MRFAFILCSLLFAFVAYANPIDSIRTEQRKEGLFVVHEVEEEETIYSIARRYGGTVDGIVSHNQISDNRIEIGQILYVLIENEESEDEFSFTARPSYIHVVQPGETLYSISKKYDVKLKELRKWNNLSDNNISPGLQLKLRKDRYEPIGSEVEIRVSEDSIEKDSAEVEMDPFAGFEKYLVRTRETLSTIANKIGVKIDSLRFWNELESDYLRIGQQLYFKASEETKANSLIEPKKKKRTQIDENGFERVYEEGVASVIQSMKTTRFLALHRTLPIGTNLKVRNLMNNQIVHVKVVGKLPGTGLNKNLLLRLSQPAYDQLGILDSKSRVEVSYSKQ